MNMIGQSGSVETRFHRNLAKHVYKEVTTNNGHCYIIVRFCVCYILMLCFCYVVVLLYLIRLVCNPDLFFFFLYRFMNFEQRYTTVAFIHNIRDEHLSPEYPDLHPSVHRPKSGSQGWVRQLELQLSEHLSPYRPIGQPVSKHMQISYDLRSNF